MISTLKAFCWEAIIQMSIVCLGGLGLYSLFVGNEWHQKITGICMVIAALLVDKLACPACGYQAKKCSH